MFARDTRASGPRLVSALLAALEVSDTEYTDYKLLTTPQLHYITRCLNTKDTPYEYGEPTEEGYYQKIAAAFKAATGTRKFNGPVTVDCANGVGGPKLRELIKYLPSPAEGGLEIKVVNDNVVAPERLNHQVNRLYFLLGETCSLTHDGIVWSRLCQDESASTTIVSRCPSGTLRISRWRCGQADVLFQRLRLHLSSFRR